jgi:hypothetical protein
MIVAMNAVIVRCDGSPKRADRKGRVAMDPT